MYIATDKIVKNDFLEAGMREISFEELMRTSVNVTQVSAVEQYWKDGNLNLHHEEGRLENVLSYTRQERDKGASRYGDSFRARAV